MKLRYLALLATTCMLFGATGKPPKATFVQTMRALLIAAPTHFQTLRGTPKEQGQFGQAYTTRPGPYAFVDITDHFATLTEHEHWTAAFAWKFDPGMPLSKAVTLTIDRMRPLTKGYRLKHIRKNASLVWLTWSAHNGQTMVMKPFWNAPTKGKAGYVSMSVRLTQPMSKDLHVAAYLHGISSAQQNDIISAAKKSTTLAMNAAATGFSTLRGKPLPLNELTAMMSSIFGDTEHDFASNVTFGTDLYTCKIESMRFPATEKSFSSKDIFRCFTPVFGGKDSLRARLRATLSNVIGSEFVFKAGAPKKTYANDQWIQASTQTEVDLDASESHGGYSYEIQVYHFVANGSP